MELKKLFFLLRAKDVAVSMIKFCSLD